VTAVFGIRTLSGWARHAPSASWCAIVDRVGGRVVTACNGSWSDADDGDPGIVSYELRDDSERCAACVKVLSPVEIGLVELAAAIATGPDSDPPFELSDEHRGGES